MVAGLAFDPPPRWRNNLPGDPPTQTEIDKTPIGKAEPKVSKHPSGGDVVDFGFGTKPDDLHVGETLWD